MKRSQQLVYLIILLADLTAVLFQWRWTEFLSKPLLCISLIFFFSRQTKPVPIQRKKLVLFALLFSLAGDILLLFAGYGLKFFLSGLVSFLVAHIFYICFFNLVRSRERIAIRWQLILPMIIYYALLIGLLRPFLGDMLMPVSIYGIVISVMLWLALHMKFISFGKAGLFMFSGAILFVVSDSVLAVNRFYQSFELAGFLVMLTYGIAQLFITIGATLYLNSVYKE